MKAVHKIGDFKGVTQGDQNNPAEAEKLGKLGIETIDDLWRCVGVNRDTGIGTVAAKATVDPELIYALLIADSLGESRHKVEEGRFGFKKARQALKRLWYARERHWLEAFLAVATLLLVALAIRAGFISLKMPEQVVVKPSTRLLPFKAIKAEDVALKRTPEEKGAFTSIEKVVGRYPLRSLAPGTTVLDEQLVGEDLTGAMSARRVLAIPVISRTLSSTLKPTAQVWLLLSPRAAGEKAPQPLLLKDVILLSVNKQGDAASVEVAVTEECLKLMEPLLGVSETFVLQPVG